MKIGIATDHRGIEIKDKLIKYLTNKKYEVIDYGANSSQSTDYPDYAILIGQKINEGEIENGILICGTGVGMCIASNKVKGIRCAKVDNELEAELAKTHNDANVISLSSFMNIDNMKKILDIFLKNKFSEEERHIRRIDKIRVFENEC